MTGITDSPLYEVWRTIKKRCYQRDYKDYKHYGARGIKMCPEWKDSYEAFYTWAMSHGYKPGLTIDRVANNRGYNPGNCKWVTRRRQANNRRSNVRLTYNGETHTMAQWCKILNIPPTTLSERFRKGWTVEKALSTPVREYHWSS